MATFTYDRPPLSNPTGLSATATVKQIKVAWDSTPYAPTTTFAIGRATVDNIAFSVLLGTTTGTDSFIDNSVVPGATYYYWVQAKSFDDVYSGASASVSTTALAVTPGILDGGIPVFNGGGYAHQKQDSGSSFSWGGAFQKFAGMGSGAASVSPTFSTSAVTSWDTWHSVVSIPITVPVTARLNVDYSAFHDWGFPTTHTDLIEIFGRLSLFNSSTLVSSYDYTLFSATPTFTRIANPMVSGLIDNNSPAGAFSMWHLTTGNSYTLRWEIKKTRVGASDAITLEPRHINMKFHFTAV